MSAPRRSAMYQALARVITESGFATDPQYTVTKAVTTAWQSAKAKTYITPVNTYDHGMMLRHKRSTRSIILAMLTDAATDETRSVYWTDDKGRPSFTDCTRALDSVVSDIEALNDQTKQYWTLTSHGIEYMRREDTILEGFDA